MEKSTRGGLQPPAGWIGGPPGPPIRGAYGPVVNVQEYAAIATASEPRIVPARLAV
jgi:hypothetical protein